MRKGKIALVMLLLVLCFMVSAITSAVSAAKPQCNKCIKDGCPSGHCYVDCVGCCYFDYRWGIICYR